MPSGNLQVSCVTIGLAALQALPLRAQARDSIRVDYSAASCSRCAALNVPHTPFRIFGNTYYVGTEGLASILITSPRGHVLIDGALPASATMIERNIRALGYRVEDVKLILNSHSHFDHAGGIAELQRASGARVAATAWSAAVIERGESNPQDPQYGTLNLYPPAHDIRIIADGETVRVGPLALTAHLTPGHTPGSTSWTWTSCEASRCLNLLYADSQTPVSADDFQFTRSTTYPNAEADFAHGLDVLEHLPCDVLLTPHPGASSLFERVAAREGGNESALVDPALCTRFVADARKAVAERMSRERAARPASAFRILQWNVSGDAWTTHAEVARRILRHADPDVLVLDEVSPSLGPDGVQRMLSGLRSPADTIWNVAFGEGGAYQRTVIASRDSVRAIPEFAVVPFPDTGRAAAAAAIPDSVRSHPTPAEGKTIGTNAALVRTGAHRLLVVGMDLTSSGAAGSWRDLRRQVEATAIRERLRQAVQRWHPDAVAVAGDMNIVTGPAPLDTLIDALANSSIGPLRAADAVHFDRWTTWTWDGRGTAFNGGRLDVVAYSAGALRAVDARVWNTELMPPDTLSAHDLTVGASASINRHRPVVVDLEYRK